MPARPSGAASVLEAVKSPDVVISAISAVVVGAVPLAYTMFPSLSSEPGPWREHRLGVALFWAVAVAFLVGAVASRQDRVQSARHKTVEDIEQSVRRAEGAVKELHGTLAEAQTQLTETVERASDLTYLTRVTELSRAVHYVVRQSTAEAERESLSAAYPIGSHILVHVRVGEEVPGAYTTWPLFPSSRILDPKATSASASARLRQEQAVQNVLHIPATLDALPVREGLSVRSVDEAMRQKLPAELRRAEQVACYPIYDDVHEPVGVLTVCAPADLKDRIDVPDSQLAASIIDLSEDLTSAVSEARSVLLERRR